MSIYERNLQAIEKKDKTLYKAVLNYIGDEDGMQLEVVSAKDGTDITKLTKDGKTWFLNSQYRPVQEAEKFAAQYDEIIDYSVMIFLGLGNGIVARQIRRVVGEHVSLLFYEPSAMIFLHTLHHFDLTDLIENPDSILFVKGLNDESLENVMNNLVRYDNYKFCIYDALPKYKQLFPEDYDNLEEKYRFTVNQILFNINTRQYFGRDMARNNIYNMRFLLQCNCEEEFKEIFPKDMPVIIVAAGPSLEKNVHLLKKAKGKAFIIAVDTALRYLAEQDIQPDLAVSVDPRKPLRLFEDDRVQNMVLALNADLNYQVVEKMSKQKLLFVSADNAYYNSMFELAGKHIHFLCNGGSVATVAFALARNWGFRRIVLIGQDLALSADKVHAGKDDIDLQKLTEKQIPVEGYYGETVYTSPDYNEYRKWYEMFIRNDKEVEVINATEGGAKIAGSIQMSLQQVLDEYCDGTFDFEGTIRNMPPAFSKENGHKLVEKWNLSVRNLEKLERKLKEGVRYAEQGIRMLQRGEYTLKKIRDVHKRIDRILEECAEMDEIYFVDSMIAEEEEDVLGDIYQTMEDDQKEYQRLLEKLKKYITSMASAVDDVKGMFEKIIEDTKEVTKVE